MPVVMVRLKDVLVDRSAHRIEDVLGKGLLLQMRVQRLLDGHVDGGSGGFALAPVEGQLAGLEGFDKVAGRCLDSGFFFFRQSLRRMEEIEDRQLLFAEFLAEAARLFLGHLAEQGEQFLEIFRRALGSGVVVGDQLLEPFDQAATARVAPRQVARFVDEVAFQTVDEQVLPAVFEALAQGVGRVGGEGTQGRAVLDDVALRRRDRIVEEALDGAHHFADVGALAVDAEDFREALDQGAARRDLSGHRVGQDGAIEPADVARPAEKVVLDRALAAEPVGGVEQGLGGAAVHCRDVGVALGVGERVEIDPVGA